jgi:hypothetical protein
MSAAPEIACGRAQGTESRIAATPDPNRPVAVLASNDPSRSLARRGVRA